MMSLADDFEVNVNTVPKPRRPLAAQLGVSRLG